MPPKKLYGAAAAAAAKKQNAAAWAAHNAKWKAISDAATAKKESERSKVMGKLEREAAVAEHYDYNAKRYDIKKGEQSATRFVDRVLHVEGGARKKTPSALKRQVQSVKNRDPEVLRVIQKNTSVRKLKKHKISKPIAQSAMVYRG